MHLGCTCTPGNLDPSDPSKITSIIPDMHTERNSSVQATSISTQVTTATLPLFREYLQQSHYLQKSNALKGEHKRVSCVLWAVSG